MPNRPPRRQYTVSAKGFWPSLHLCNIEQHTRYFVRNFTANTISDLSVFCHRLNARRRVQSDHGYVYSIKIKRRSKLVLPPKKQLQIHTNNSDQRMHCSLRYRLLVVVVWCLWRCGSAFNANDKTVIMRHNQLPLHGYSNMLQKKTITYRNACLHCEVHLNSAKSIGETRIQNHPVCGNCIKYQHSTMTYLKE